MKTYVLMPILCLGFLGYSQTYPIDFSDPLDVMNCFDCTFSITTDNGNDVASITGGGLPFDTAQLNLAQNLNLSDDNNNTITFRVKPAADYGTRTHLLKFEGGTGPVTELQFTTSGTSWQNISLNFGPGLGNYNLMVLFTDFNNALVGTYLFDDFAGGTNVPPPPTPNGPPPTPTAPITDVLMIYGDTGNYTNIWVPEYEFGGNTIVDLDPTAVVNNAIKMNFSCCGWGQGRNSVTDISAYNYVQFDYWTAAATQLRFILIENDGTVNEFFYELPAQQPFVVESWTHVQIPLSCFTNLGFSKDKFFQYKLGTVSDLFPGIIYFDNIYFTMNLLSVDEYQLSQFKVFPNPSNSEWTIESDNLNISKIELYSVLGKQVQILTPNSNKVKIDASNLVNGLYFAKIFSDDKVNTVKLIKN